MLPENSLDCRFLRNALIHSALQRFSWVLMVGRIAQSCYILLQLYCAESFQPWRNHSWLYTYSHRIHFLKLKNSLTSQWKGTSKMPCRYYIFSNRRVNWNYQSTSGRVSLLHLRPQIPVIYNFFWAWFFDILLMWPDLWYWLHFHSYLTSHCELVKWETLVPLNVCIALKLCVVVDSKEICRSCFGGFFIEYAVVTWMLCKNFV
jgi:hypothetical protein